MSEREREVGKKGREKKRERKRIETRNYPAKRADC